MSIEDRLRKELTNRITLGQVANFISNLDIKRSEAEVKGIELSFCLPVGLERFANNLLSVGKPFTWYLNNKVSPYIFTKDLIVQQEYLRFEQGTKCYFINSNIVKGFANASYDIKPGVEWHFIGGDCLLHKGLGKSKIKKYIPSNYEGLSPKEIVKRIDQDLLICDEMTGSEFETHSSAILEHVEKLLSPKKKPFIKRLFGGNT